MRLLVPMCMEGPTRGLDPEELVWLQSKPEPERLGGAERKALPAATIIIFKV